MLHPKLFIDTLKDNEIDFYTGVPDSLLKNICAYITDNLSAENNITAVNEGTAVALAAGYHLSTSKIPVVYMQNSGIGNAINPILSLMDKEVYNLPMLMLIGWRGEPGIKDEPQHIKQGKTTIPILESIGLRNTILDKEVNGFIAQINEAIDFIKKTNEPFAFIIQKDTFEEYKPTNQISTDIYSLSREEAIKSVIDALKDDDIIVSTTGMISRELFEYRELKGHGHSRDFLTVGSMGHASQIALGIAMQKKDRRIVCFDGDGALLMHMGSIATIGTIAPENYIHIIYNNGAHDSVGGQSTISFQIDIPTIAKACGYKNCYVADSINDINNILQNQHQLKGPVLIEIKVKKGARKDLGRPTTTTFENKKSFIDFLK